MIFTLLVWGETVVDNAGICTILGFGIAFFYVWQIIDSVRTAKALQMGQTPPDPFGLAQAFGAAEPAPPGQPMQPAQATEATPPIQDSHGRCGSNWSRCVVPVANRGSFRVRMGSGVAVLSDWPGNLDVRRSRGLGWFAARCLLSQWPQTDHGRAGRAGHHRGAFAARELWWPSLAPHLATAAACDWYNETVGEQDTAGTARDASGNGAAG